MIFRNKDGDNVATMGNDKTLVATLHSRMHKLRSIDGYYFDEDILESAILAGCEKVMVIEGDTGDVWTSDIDTFVKKGVPFNLGNGDIKGLPGHYWTKAPHGQEKLW